MAQQRTIQVVKQDPFSDARDLEEVSPSLELEVPRAHAKSEHAKDAGILDLLLKFLESTGNALLIRGHPGVGKTTLAFELLRNIEGSRIGEHAIPPSRLYVSSRISPTRLRKHFPWINEVVDSMSGRAAKASWAEGIDYFRVSEADNILNKVLALKHSRQRGLIVIDSWEGALRNTTEEGRRMLESAILSEPDESKVSVVLVSENERSEEIAHLVDGVVTLSSSKENGREMRTLVVDKLRGLRVQNPLAVFSLEGGRFTPLPRTRFHNGDAAARKIPVPIPHSESFYSTGSLDLDRMLEGGVKKGSFVLLDINETVSHEAVTLFLNMTRANFVNQGGYCFILPQSNVSSKNIAESLRPYIGNDALEKRVRITEYNKELPSEKWRLPLEGDRTKDFSAFYNCWNELVRKSSVQMMTMDFDQVIQVYGEGPTLPAATQMGAGIRDSRALIIGLASSPSKIREEFLRTADYNLKLEIMHGSLVIYGIRPFTNFHGCAFTFDKGYPSLALTEMV